MPINTEVTITEIEEFEPSRVDGVGKGANGFPILMLKQLDGDAEKADDSPPCKTCDGSGKPSAQTKTPRLSPGGLIYGRVLC